MDTKKVIAPLQRWLLANRRCLGCGQVLDSSKRQRKNGIFLTTCACKRTFIYDQKLDSYQRALFEEL